MSDAIFVLEVEDRGRKIHKIKSGSTMVYIESTFILLLMFYN